MIRHDPVLPPELLYPIEEWRWVEKAFAARFLAQAETVFTVSNGYLGLRGAFEEGEPAYRHGTFVNGFHETWPIPYGEWAFGFATTGQTIVNAPDAKIIRLYVDDEPFDLTSARILRFERALDMRAGTLDRQVLWETPAGRQLLVESRRLVSFHEKHVAAISYRVTVVNANAALVLSSEIVEHPPVAEGGTHDPRHARASADRALSLQAADAHDHRLVLGYTTARSGMALACGVDHVLETECAFLLGHEFSPEQKKRNFDYYDRLTTGDSSLSSCIQSIVAFEVGDDEIALRYLINALLMDLADVGGNVKDGCHIASMGGTWMGAVYGLAGLRDHGGRLSFRPHKLVRDLRFRLAVRGQRLAVHVGSGGTTYELEEGTGLTIHHRDERLDLRPGEPIRRP